jgi:FlaA1/EpsC-like NDP-sugar epimerase
MFLLDSLIIFLSAFFVYFLFHRGYHTMMRAYPLANVMLLYIALSWVGMRLFHTYSGIMRYSSFVDLTRVAYANALSVLLVGVAHYAVNYLPGTHVEHLRFLDILTIYGLATLLMWAMRIVVKTLYDVLVSNKKAMRVLIYGTMSGGVALAKSIRAQVPRQFVLKGFITSDPHDTHDQLMGEHIYGVDDDLLSIIEKAQIEGVLVSPIRTDEFRNDQHLQDMLIDAGVRIFMMPAPKPADGKEPLKEEEGNELSQLREVSVEDLLPRDEITVDMTSIAAQLTGKRILITGSAGSIGSEIVRQVATFKPAAMMLIDQAETPEHDIRLLMSKSFPDIEAATIVTDITHVKRMENIFSTFRPDYVFHAAAYKHVPMMEDNPCEAVYNNVYGTKILADLSVKYGVSKFVMVSTDKAVNPTNVMGCSKRICEIYVQALDRSIAADGSKVTKFVTTRFGNVLGSNGSVIPLFKEQIKAGGPVTVTHPDIIRYFMLIPEACKLVLEAGTKGDGGEIFVFDMGKPVRIADLAQRMIRLSGARNVKIEFTGLREGEKLYEEVLNEQENTKPSFHKKIRIAEVRQYDFQEVRHEIDELIEQALHYDDMATVRKMKDIVPEYKSNNSVYEQLDADR